MPTKEKGTAYAVPFSYVLIVEVSVNTDTLQSQPLID